MTFYGTRCITFSVALLKDFSGMPTALREALANGSPDVTAFVTHSCSKAVETVSS